MSHQDVSAVKITLNILRLTLCAIENMRLSERKYKGFGNFFLLAFTDWDNKHLFHTFSILCVSVFRVAFLLGIIFGLQTIIIIIIKDLISLYSSPILLVYILK